MATNEAVEGGVTVDAAEEAEALLRTLWRFPNGLKASPKSLPSGLVSISLGKSGKSSPQYIKAAADLGRDQGVSGDSGSVLAVEEA